MSPQFHSEIPIKMKLTFKTLQYVILMKNKKDMQQIKLSVLQIVHFSFHVSFPFIFKN